MPKSENYVNKDEEKKRKNKKGKDAATHVQSVIKAEEFQ